MLQHLKKPNQKEKVKLTEGGGDSRPIRGVFSQREFWKFEFWALLNKTYTEIKHKNLTGNFTHVNFLNFPVTKVFTEPETESALPPASLNAELQRASGFTDTTTKKQQLHLQTFWGLISSLRMNKLVLDSTDDPKTVSLLVSLREAFSFSEWSLTCTLWRVRCWRCGLWQEWTSRCRSCCHSCTGWACGRGTGCHGFAFLRGSETRLRRLRRSCKHNDDLKKTTTRGTYCTVSQMSKENKNATIFYFSLIHFITASKSKKTNTKTNPRRSAAVWQHEGSVKWTECKNKLKQFVELKKL